MEHQIITGDSLPVRQKTRRIPDAWKEEVNAQIQEMLKNDIIRPSSSPWNSPFRARQEEISQFEIRM